MAWTQDRVIVLKKLWGAGHSASQIAQQLGGVTRNAVIGKVYRLGLSSRVKPARPLSQAGIGGAKSGRKVATAQPASPARLATPKPSAVKAGLTVDPVVEQGVASVFSLRENMCKWPIGDPSDSDFRFCCRKATTGPYCAEHAKIAFQPARKRDQESQSA